MRDVKVIFAAVLTGVAVLTSLTGCGSRIGKTDYLVVSHKDRAVEPVSMNKKESTQESFKISELAMITTDDVVSASNSNVETTKKLREASKSISLETPQLVEETGFTGDSYADSVCNTTHPYGMQSTSLTLQWNEVDNATEYCIELSSGGSIASYESNDTGICINELEPDTIYSVRIQSRSGESTSAWSDYMEFETARINYTERDLQSLYGIISTEALMTDYSVVDVTMSSKVETYIASACINRVLAGYNSSVTEMVDGELGSYYNYNTAKSGAESYSYNFWSADADTYRSIMANNVYNALYWKSYDNPNADKVYFWESGTTAPASTVVSCPWFNWDGVNTYVKSSL